MASPQRTAKPASAGRAAREKTPKAGAPAAKRGKRRAGQHLDAVVEEGASIDFPNGESLRITRIEGDTITIEKTP